MRAQHQILSNLNENKEDWYYLCNDAEQALLKVRAECKDENAIKAIERMILELNSIRMEQYEALTEYALVEEEIYSNLDNMVDALRTNFKGIINQDYIKKSLRFHYDNDFISEDEYKELYNEFIASKNSVVKSYEDLPFEDFRARNTIGALKDGKSFVIFDDNDVYIIKGSIEELKKIIYSDEDQDLELFDKFMSKNSKRADNRLETQILVDTKRLSPEVLDESTEENNTLTDNITANIYQIESVADCDYAFSLYDFAKNKIDFADYKLVASLEVPKSDNINETLENIFRLGNLDKDKFNILGKFRSISVSDIIEIDGNKYYVDDFGFKLLNNNLNESTKDEEIPELESPYHIQKRSDGRYQITSSHPYDLSDYSFAISDSLDGEYSIYKHNPNYSVYMDLKYRPEQNLFVAKADGYMNALEIMKDVDKGIEPKIDRT